MDEEHTTQSQQSMHEREDKKVLYRYMVELDNAAQFNDLLAVTQQALEQYPNDAYTLAYKARALQKLNLLSAATIANDQALLLDTNLALAWINRSGLHLLQKKFTEALRSSQRAVELAPTAARAWANRGVALLNFGDMPAALYAFEHSLLYDARSTFALNMKTDILLKARRLNEVVTTTQRTLAIDPTNREALTFAVTALRSLERYEELRDVAHMLSQLVPTSVFARENLVRALRGMGNFEEANEACEPLFSLVLDSERYWTLKADTLYRLERYREAAAAADVALRINTEYPPARRIREKSLQLMYQRKKKR